MHLQPPVAEAAVRSNVVVLLLFIHLLVLIPLWGCFVFSLFCYAIRCVFSIFAIILVGHGEMITLR